MLVIMPILFGGGCYLMGLVFFSVYNLIAKKYGGIEVEFDDDNGG